MISGYSLSKIFFTLFGASTVVIILLFYGGIFIDIAGSVVVAILIWSINTLMLIASILWYVYEKSYREAKKSRDVEILESFASRNDEEAEFKEN